GAVFSFASLIRASQFARQTVVLRQSRWKNRPPQTQPQNVVQNPVGQAKKQRWYIVPALFFRLLR
ncbi:MAG: hypothetical protein PUJ09_01615, partial [Eubacteriales bacterium]|nr:hypothetical protein [Eubacteriales bacterium]